MIIGLIFSVFGIGFLCWLLFTLAVYALPFFAGVTAGLAAYHSGAGALGGIVVGFLAGAATLLLGQLAFATVRWPGDRHRDPMRGRGGLLFCAGRHCPSAGGAGRWS